MESIYQAVAEFLGKSGAAFLGMLLVAGCCGNVFATSYTFGNGGGTFTWSNSNNWSPVGVPGSSGTTDSASITAGGGAPTNNGWTVTYDYTGASETLASLTISHSGTLFHGTDFLTIGDSTTTLNAQNEYLGDSGNKGFGGITQTGGANHISTALQLGVDASDIGTYNLGGDGSLSASTASIGMAGAGTVTQTGGTANLSSLVVGAGAGNGTYNLSSTGYLSVNSEQIGTNAGTGTFTQTGGTNDATNASVTIGADGSYSLSGTGVFLANTETVAGTFAQTGGTHTIGSNTSGSGYYLYIRGSYTLSDPGVLAVHGDEKIGVNSGDIATFTQTGGQHTIDYGNLTIGDGTGSSGSYTLSGGTLSAQEDETVGNSGVGTFTQSNNTSNTVGGTLTIGTGSTYTLGDTASLKDSTGETVDGTFAQNGGSNFAGSNSNSLTALLVSGNYQLNSGSLELSGLELIAGGSMVQSGGTSIVTGSIPDTAMAIVGDLNGGTNAGTYTLSSGAALIVNGALHVGGINITSQNTTANQALPAGVLTVNGGTLVVSELIKLWTGPGNAINFSAGSISTPELDGDVSEFNWTGGTLDFTAPAGLTVGTAGFFQNLSLNTGMTLTATSVNIASGGTFTINGGTLNSGGVLTLSSGTLTGSNPITNSQQIIGYGTIAGSGGFTNSGAITIPNGIIALSNTGALASTGTITLSAGTQLQMAGGNLANTGVINLGGGTISGSATLNNNSTGVISGYGTISAPLANNTGATLLVQTGTVNLTHPMNNAGTINLVGPASTLAGSAITNNGVITGNGVINNSLTNASSGELRALPGQWLIIHSTASPNAGKINLQGGTIEFNSALSNTGTISGHGALNADSGLTNTGKMLFSSGYTDLNGSVTNNSGGNITITGGGFTTFYNAFANNAGATVQVSADSVATFEGAVTGSGSFTGAGTKIFDGGAPSSVIALASVVGNTVVEAPANLSLNSFDENSIDVEGIATVRPVGTSNQTNSLTIGSAAKLDLGNNSLTVFYSGQSPAPTIRTYLTSGYDTGRWSGAGGIDSSAATVSRGATSLGYLDNGTQVLIKYTWAGDANLDGLVNTSDLSAISPAGSTWQTGDFNYDGKINADDYTLFMLGAAVSNGINISTTLPEPCSVLGIGVWILSRPRRNSSRQWRGPNN